MRMSKYLAIAAITTALTAGLTVASQAQVDTNELFDGSRPGGPGSAINVPMPPPPPEPPSTSSSTVTSPPPSSP